MEACQIAFINTPNEPESFMAGKCLLDTCCIHMYWCDITAIYNNIHNYKLSVGLEMKMKDLIFGLKSELTLQCSLTFNIMTSIYVLHMRGVTDFF